MKYEWRNVRTGKVVENDSPTEPPLKGKWKRVYSFGVGRVEGGANSPARTSVKYNS
jgi:hypothetical protein